MRDILKKLDKFLGRYELYSAIKKFLTGIDEKPRGGQNDSYPNNQVSGYLNDNGDSAIDRAQEFLEKQRVQPLDNLPEEAIAPPTPSPERFFWQTPPRPDVEILEINGDDAWDEQLARLKNTQVLRDCLAAYQSLIATSKDFGVFCEDVNELLEKIPGYVDKNFDGSRNFDAETSQKWADKIVEFAQHKLFGLFDSIYNALQSNKHLGESERQFYTSFREALEVYLANIGIDMENPQPGDDFRQWRNNFSLESYNLISTDDPSKYNTIAEVELAPHFVPFINDRDDEDKSYILGKVKIYVQQQN